MPVKAKKTSITKTREDADSNTPGRPAPGKTVRRWVRRGMITAAVLLIAAVLLAQALRKIAVRQIATLTNSRVQTGAVELNLNGSVLIRQLAIRPSQEQIYDDSILKAQTVFARFSVWSLLLLRPRLTHVNISNFVFSALFDLDRGEWNTAALAIRFPQEGGAKMPIVELAQGTLQYAKVSDGHAATVAEVPIDARFAPAENPEDGYSLNITTAEREGFRRSTLTGFWRRGCITLAGPFSSADVAAFERVWTIDVSAAELRYDRDNNYSLRLRIKDLHTIHRPADKGFLLDGKVLLSKYSGFAALQQFFDQYQPAGQVDIELEAGGNFRQVAASKLKGTIYCRDASICYRTFPYLIDHIVGRIDFDEQSVELGDVRGRHKDVELTFDGWYNAAGETKYEISIKSRNMALDGDLYNALRPWQKTLWSAFSPGGLAEIDYRSAKQADTDRKWTLSVGLLGADALYQSFPYPLRNLKGTIVFDESTVTFHDLVSEFDGRRIKISGTTTAPGIAQPSYEIGIDAENVPLDSALAAALPEKQRRSYDKLEIAGLADAAVRVSAPPQSGKEPNVIAVVLVRQSRIKTEHLPFALSDTSAKLTVTPQVVQIDSLEGRCGQAAVSLSGHIRLADEGPEHAYCLALKAQQLPLGKDLVSILPAKIENIVSMLQATGSVNLEVDLKKNGESDCPAPRLVVDCLGNSATPEWFPYPFRNIRGRLTIADDTIRLEDITATAECEFEQGKAQPALRLNGQVSVGDNSAGGGSFHLSAENIFFDDRLAAALPESLQPVYEKLAPAGRFHIDLEQLKISNADDGQKQVEFAGEAKFNSCSFDIVVPITDLDASLKLKGSYKAGSGCTQAYAFLSAERVKIRGESLTALQTEITFDPVQKSWSAGNLMADWYGGKLTGKFALDQPQQKPFKYELQLGFHNVDLSQFLHDLSKPGPSARIEPAKGSSENSPAERTATSGKIFGCLSVSGYFDTGSQTAGEVSAPSEADGKRIGKCRLTLSNMQVGRLSPLAKLLYVLKLTEPGHFAFDRMFVDSYIKDDRLFVERLDLAGRAVAFTGEGWLNLKDQAVDLLLLARAPRAAGTEPSVLQSLTESLASGVVQMEVKGDLYNPQITTTSLPVIKGALGLLGTKPREQKQ